MSKNDNRRLIIPEIASLEAADDKARLEEMKESGEVSYNPKEYRYFNYKNFENGLGLDEKVKSDALKLIAQEEYSNFRVNLGFSLGANKKMTGFASAGFPYGERVELNFDRERLTHANCTSWRCYESRLDFYSAGRYRGNTNGKPNKGYLNRSLCVHEAMLLLLVEQYLEEKNPGDETNVEGHNLLTAVLGKRRGKIRHTEKNENAAKEAKPDIAFKPYVMQEASGYQLCFQAGKEKLLKVKDIDEFVKASRTGEEMTFGTKTVLSITRDKILESDRKWLDMCTRIINEEHQRGKYLFPKGSNRYYNDPDMYEYKIKGNIPLFGDNLDRFFEAAGDEEIEFRLVDPVSGSKKKMGVKMAEMSIRPVLNVSVIKDKKSGEVRGIAVNGEMPQLIQGNRYSYYLKVPKLYRTIEQGDPLMDALQANSTLGKINLVFGRHQIKDFYYNILPQLRDIADVTEAGLEQIMPYIPPKPQMICYMDVDERYIFCRPVAAYGERSCSMTDLAASDYKNIPYAKMRDLDAEEDVLSVLNDYFKKYDPELEIMLEEKDEDGMFRLLDQGLDRIMEYAEVRATDSFRRLNIRKRFTTNVGVSLQSNIMNLDVTSNELSKDELLSILDGYRQKKHYVRLKNGDFVKLDENEDAARLSELMGTLHLSLKDFVKGKMHIPAYRAFYLDTMLENAESVYTDRDRAFRALIKNFKTASDSDVEVPESLKKTLRKYQVTGYQWLRMLDRCGFGGILADEMGLGKTLQVITTLLAVKKEREQESAEHNNNSESKVSIIVCPASLVYNWGEELRKFAPSLRTVLVLGNAAHRSEIIETAKSADFADVLVTSYDLLKRDIEHYSGMNFRFEIIDEAQYIKNHSTAAAKAVKVITAQTKFALTGTPIENRLSELWSIFDYLMPGFLYEYTAFKRDFETAIVKYQDKEATEKLSKMVTPFILRRLKSQVLKDLPEKLEEIRYAGMESKQQQLYDAQVTRMKELLGQQSDEEFGKSKLVVLSQLTRIRQICCDPELVYENYGGESAKREACMELIQDAIEGGHRMLIFSQFTQMLSLLEQELDKAKIPYYKIIGDTPKKRRLELVNDFNNGDVPVFLISLKAGGTGLNLTGADMVIHYDPWWNTAVQNQATDRAHRIGQTKIVTVYRLIMKNTIEEKIVELQEQKKQLADDILSGEELNSASITREDLLAML